MAVLNRTADRFQRALDGERPSDAELAAFVETSRHLVGVGGIGPAPDPVFVTRLRDRLMAEAHTLPTASPAGAKAAAARRAAARSAPVVVVVGRGLPRLLAGAVASALLVASVVGLASRTAVPGDVLYPVKGWIDGVAVRLADSDFDRGTTYLAQAQRHISDARELSGRSDPHPADVDVALEAAIGSVRRGQQSLDTAYATTANPQALLALRDFTARALPQIDALRTEAPPESLRLVDALEALLRDSQDATARRIAACGTPCRDIGLASSGGPATLPGSLPTTTTTAAPTVGSSITVPGTAVTGQPGGGGSSAPAPGVTAGVAGGGVGVGGGGAGVSSGGASAGLPTVSLSVPLLPSATATVPLPSASIGTGGVSATVPGATLGPITAPGIPITLP